MRTVLFLSALAFLCYGIFTMAMNASNLYIIATEGLQLRAECILQDGPGAELTAYFTEGFLDKDPQLAGTAYDDYNITNFDYRISVESVSAWPWSNTANITVVDHMSITGSIYEDKKPEGADRDTEYPLPEWEDGRYRIYFNKKNGRWLIYQMVLLDAAPSVKPQLTPDMRMTPRPAYTTPPPSTTPTPTKAPTPTPAQEPTAIPEE